ncbi:MULTISPECIES: hypothetical protein [Mesorhizobium]|uniref:Uncharacterized protein n=2 Tax=Mesorhizobium TaxID=68287 RepID=A0A1A5J619_RHILI|nr:MULTISPECIES: hypothetical protein [Mesorhizobium]ETA72347.1 hypothetical protein MesloDRAFT_1217 [Mesorhizobium japonicum R7A]MBE1709678.1 hypothetical protein [Mesorhizobium japonicum]MBE1714347.1 hypothetical protein [Mesorhizobium japonicum]MUT25327.1 hypothetical protein [Mesorhizobium japonicum]MUT28619.1 hypothetical protein [Mesorhizobium japonicum]
MTAFTALEIAALHSIFSETPKLTSALERQLTLATVTKRQNSGVGFFTSIAVADDVPLVSNSSRVLGNETQAHVAGLELGFGFVLFLEDGKLDLLEGFNWGSESTASLDLAAVTFEVYKRRLIGT